MTDKKNVATLSQLLSWLQLPPKEVLQAKLHKVEEARLRLEVGDE